MTNTNLDEHCDEFTRIINNRQHKLCFVYVAMLIIVAIANVCCLCNIEIVDDYEKSGEVVVTETILDKIVANCKRQFFKSV